MQGKSDDKDCFSPVSDAESGQKLLRFLERRIQLPEALFQRWIRQGQIRINGSRCKPYDRVLSGDVIRIPPFTQALVNNFETIKSKSLSGHQYSINNVNKKDLKNKDSFATYYTNDAKSCENICQQLVLLEKWKNIWAFNKPAGLPTQSGSGHKESVCSILQRLDRNSFFKPAPAHRLDIQTSGVLLVGSTYESLRYLQDSFQKRMIHKEYLAWVKGHWAYDHAVLLRHFLRKERIGNMTKIHTTACDSPYAKEALCVCQPVAFSSKKTLMQIRLLTGRCNQIRAQFQQIGYPVVGDQKYDPARTSNVLLLHAFRIILPDEHEFFCLPSWHNDFKVCAILSPICAGMSIEEIISTCPEIS